MGSLEANDIGPQLYSQNPNATVNYYLEGVKPGKITLEFSYQNGSNGFKFEQKFLVTTKKHVNSGVKRFAIKSGCKNLRSARRIHIPTSPKSIQPLASGNQSQPRTIAD